MDRAAGRVVTALAPLLLTIIHQNRIIMADVKIDQVVLDGILTSLSEVETEVEQLVTSSDNNLDRANVAGITDKIAAIKTDVDNALASVTPPPAPPADPGSTTPVDGTPPVDTGAPADGGTDTPSV
jgi:hypothetical protein